MQKAERIIDDELLGYSPFSEDKWYLLSAINSREQPPLAVKFVREINGFLEFVSQKGSTTIIHTSAPVIFMGAPEGVVSQDEADLRRLKDKYPMFEGLSVSDYKQIEELDDGQEV